MNTTNTNTDTTTNTTTTTTNNGDTQMKNSAIWNEATASHRAEIRKLRAEALAKLNASASWADAVASVKRGNALFAEKKVAAKADLDDVIARLEAKAAERAERAEARKKAFIAKMKENCKFTSTPWAFVLANTTEKQRTLLLNDDYFTQIKASADKLKAEAERKAAAKRKKEAKKARAEEKAKQARLASELAKKNAQKAESLAQKAAMEVKK